MAPGMFPIPPTTAAVNALSPAKNPIVWLTFWKISPFITPAAPASAEPMKKVATITRSTSMPIIAAPSRSNAVARIAFPSRVRPTKSVSATIRATAEEMTRMRSGEIFSTPAVSGRKSLPS